jgi:membrane associated rhomboid family serine protease
MLFVLGLLIERAFGNKLMLIITLVSMIFSGLGGFILVNFIGIPEIEGSKAGISGASGIFYGYAPLCIYIIFQKFKTSGTKLFKTKYIYVLFFELILMLIVTPLLALDAPATNLIHLLSFLGGTLVVLFYILNKTKKEALDNSIFDSNSKNLQFNKLYYLLLILPVFLISLYIII